MYATSINDFYAFSLLVLYMLFDKIGDCDVLQGTYSSADMLDSAYLQQQQQLRLQQQQQQQLLQQQQQQQQQLLLLQEQQRLQVQLQQQQLQMQQQQLLNARAVSASPAPVDAFAAGMSSSGSYQMRSMLLSQQQQQFNTSRQQLMSSGNVASFGYDASAASVPNLMAAEEIRVDCIHLTTNGRFVVTGSIYGPPQVWDLKVVPSSWAVDIH
jgi:hypothetical protein